MRRQLCCIMKILLLMFQCITLCSRNSSSQKLETQVKFCRSCKWLHYPRVDPQYRNSHKEKFKGFGFFFFPVSKLAFGSRHWNTKDNFYLKWKFFRHWSCTRLGGLSGPTGSPKPSYNSQAHTQECLEDGLFWACHLFQMFRWHRSFPSIPTWKAWLLSWSQDTVHVFHTICGHRTRARHGEVVFSKCRHMCASVLLFLISQGWCWGPHSAVI